MKPLTRVLVTLFIVMAMIKLSKYRPTRFCEKDAICKDDKMRPEGIEGDVQDGTLIWSGEGHSVKSPSKDHEMQQTSEKHSMDEHTVVESDEYYMEQGEKNCFSGIMTDEFVEMAQKELKKLEEN